VISNNAGGEILRITNAGFLGLGPMTAPTKLIQLAADSAMKPSTTTWTVTSDARTKRNIKDLVGGLDIIRKLRPIEAEYNGLAGLPEGERVLGFLAQEIAAILPGTVGTHSAKLAETDTEDTEILDFNIHEVLIHLVLAVQQLAGALPAKI
jgi:hypothetical protein